LESSDAVVRFRARDQDAIEADKLKDFLHMAAGLQHGEGVACFARVSVKPDEGGETRGVNALHRGEIERHIFADDFGRQLIDETLLLPADEFLEPQHDFSGRFNPIGAHKKLLARDGPRTPVTDVFRLAGRLILALPGPRINSQQTY
jgi:hypothetical protein